MVIHRLGSVNIPSVNQVFNTNPKTTRFEHEKTLDVASPRWCMKPPPVNLNFFFGSYKPRGQNMQKKFEAVLKVMSML